MASIQTLGDTERRLLARWALACAERVLQLFKADPVAEQDIQEAVLRTRAYADGEITTAEVIRRRLIAVKAAKAATTPAGAVAARSVAQAAAVAHMAAHALGAAAYAVKAVSLVDPGNPEALRDEIRWQLEHLSEEQRSALRLLPPLGTDSSGPLGEGLLSRGILGSTIREIQADLT